MRRIVIKVGSAVLTEDGALAKERMLNLVELIAKLSQTAEVILVSSGAVAAGYTVLPLDKSVVKNKQALASIGQPFLMKSYQIKFEKFGKICSQVLLTADDFDSRKRTKYAKSVVDNLLGLGVVPIINENDVTATDELVFGDNDQLSAHVAYHFYADMLVILSDIKGYYDKDPRKFSDARLRKEVGAIEPSDLEVKHSPNNAFATGGIVTKLMAADFLLQKGLPTFLASGFDLSDAKSFLLEGIHQRGTLFKRGENE